MQSKLILVGVISSAHGIKGHVIVKSFTNPVNNILNLSLIDEKGNDIKIEYIGNHKTGGIICSLKSCNSRGQAEMLKKTALYCERVKLPAAQNNEFYFEDLLDIMVKDKDGNDIGTIINVANYGAGDLIEIKFNDKKQTEFILFTADNFPEINEKYVVLSNIPIAD